MKSWKTRLLIAFTMVTMMMAVPAPATAQPFVWVPCFDWWQDPSTGQWWCLTTFGATADIAEVAAVDAEAPEELIEDIVDDLEVNDLEVNDLEVNDLEVNDLEDEDEDEDEDE